LYFKSREFIPHLIALYTGILMSQLTPMPSKTTTD